MKNKRKTEKLDDYLLKRLLTAVATVEASFPAGEYHLNERQNLALNELNDVSALLLKESPYFKSEFDIHRNDYDVWQLTRMCNMGLITGKMLDAALKERGL